MISKSEVLRLIEEYESVSSLDNIDEKETVEHPEGSVSEQTKFLNQIQALLEVVQKKIAVNPFEDTESQLVTLDTGECLDPEINESLQHLYQDDSIFICIMSRKD